MADSDEPALALEPPPPRTLDDGAPDDTVTDDKTAQHVRAKAGARPRPTDVTTTPVTYDISDTIRVPTFDPDAVIRKVTQAAKEAKDKKTFESDIDDLVAKGMIAANGVAGLGEAEGVHGESGMAMLQRTAEMEAKGKRAAAVLEQFTKFPPQPIEVYYEILGGEKGDAVPVLITPRSRKGLEGARVIANRLVKLHGCKCIIWDRPNTGRSGISWEGYGNEAEMQSDYLNLLLAHLNLSPVVLYGEEFGGRFALIHALRYPEDVGALILENLPSGQAAARYLSRKFYMQYLDTLSIYNKDGLFYVAKEKHFEAMIQKNPANARRLLGVDDKDFKAVINRWAKPITEGGDTWTHPVLGVESSRLRELQVPTLCLFTWNQEREEDAMHTEETMQAVVECVAGAYPAVLVPVRPTTAREAAIAAAQGPTQFDEELGHWIKSLPKPLVPKALLPKATATATAIANDLRATAAKAMTAFKTGGNGPMPEQVDTCTLFQGMAVAGQQMRTQQQIRAARGQQPNQCSVM